MISGNTARAATVRSVMNNMSEIRMYPRERTFSPPVLRFRNFASGRIAPYIRSALRQRNTLSVIVQHILNVHGGGRDVQNTVAAVNDVAFDRNEYVLTLGEKDFLGLAGLVGKAEK